MRKFLIVSAVMLFGSQFANAGPIQRMVDNAHARQEARAERRAARQTQSEIQYATPVRSVVLPIVANSVHQVANFIESPITVFGGGCASGRCPNR